jgi:transposase
MRTGDGHPIPPHLRVEVNRLHRRLVMTLEMIREMEAEREQALQTQDDTASRTIQALRRIRGIGGNFAAVLTRTVLSLAREPAANRQPSRPYANTFRSGGMDRDRRISRQREGRKARSSSSPGSGCVISQTAAWHVGFASVSEI